jgi:hypothetical protein
MKSFVLWLITCRITYLLRKKKGWRGSIFSSYTAFRPLVQRLDAEIRNQERTIEKNQIGDTQSPLKLKNKLQKQRKTIENKLDLSKVSIGKLEDLLTASAKLRRHGRMARGGHGLPKVSPGLAMPNPSTLCRLATPETALRLFIGWPAHRAGSLQLSSTLLDTPRRPLMFEGPSMTSSGTRESIFDGSRSWRIT